MQHSQAIDLTHHNKHAMNVHIKVGEQTCRFFSVQHPLQRFPLELCAHLMPAMTSHISRRLSGASSSSEASSFSEASTFSRTLSIRTGTGQRQPAITPKTSNSDTFRFLHLPKEIRLQIYDLVFADIEVPSWLDLDQSGQHSSSQFRATRFRHTSLVLTCRRIFVESHPIFRSAVRYHLYVSNVCFEFAGKQVGRWELCPKDFISSLRRAKRLQLNIEVGAIVLTPALQYFQERLLFLFRHLQQSQPLELSIEIKHFLFYSRTANLGADTKSWVNAVTASILPFLTIGKTKSFVVDPFVDPGYGFRSFPVLLRPIFDNILIRCTTEELLQSTLHPDKLFEMGYAFQNYNMLVYDEISDLGLDVFEERGTKFVKARKESLCYPYVTCDTRYTLQMALDSWHLPRMRIARSRRVTRSATEEDVVNVKALDEEVSRVEKDIRERFLSA